MAESTSSFVKPHGFRPWLARRAPSELKSAGVAGRRRASDDNLVEYCAAQDAVETCQPPACIFFAQCAIALDQDKCAHYQTWGKSRIGGRPGFK